MTDAERNMIMTNNKRYVGGSKVAEPPGGGFQGGGAPLDSILYTVCYTKLRFWRQFKYLN